MKPIATITDRAAMKDVTFVVTVQFKRTLRGRFGFWLLGVSARLSAWLMNCAIEVKSDE